VGHQLGSPKATTIAELIKGKFREGSDAHIRKLNLWVEQHARARAASLTDKFVTTLKVAKDMLAVARLVRENGTMGLVYGPSGIGKSRCALAIHDKYVGSVYVPVIPGYHHSKGLTHALAVKLGVRTQHVGTQREVIYSTQLERVIDVLRDSNRMLILDEAGNLTDSAIELLRAVHDTTGAPILLIATKTLHERIVKNADPDHGQLYSRFDVIWHLTEGRDAYAGGKALHTIEDIKALYNEPPVRLTPDAARYLRGVADDLGHGSLRRCRILLNNAVRRARKRQNLSEGERVTVTGDDLEWVENQLRRESSEQETAKDRRRRVAGLVSG